MKVEVRELTRQFGKTRAVDSVSFTVGSGQIVGFIGPNGSGKTTTMRIMATLDEPTSGDVLIDGVSVIERPETARRQIGFMPDSLPAHRDMTVHQYVDFFARAYGLPSPQREETVEAIEHFTGLLPMRDKMLVALSKGMKQRVSLARALVHDPPLLIMDEPSAGLDPRARIELRELLEAISQQGKAVLISSHILSELREICDAALIIERGRLLFAGSMDELMTSGGAEHRTLAIRVLGDAQPITRQAVLMPGVLDVRPAGTWIEIDLDGDETSCARLLKELVLAGHRIVECKLLGDDLESLFMRITKGELQ